MSEPDRGGDRERDRANGDRGADRGGDREHDDRDRRAAGDDDYEGYGDAADADDSGPGPDADADDTPEEAAVSTMERVVMVLAVALTVGLFGFAVWSAFAGASAAEPTASVAGERGTSANATYYGVVLRNEGDAGLVSATVSVACPEPRRRVTFENVPANARRNATVGCPAGAGPPSAEVVSWIPA
ncbi:hypothetical protein [Halosimplex halophilum]|uniref:hypothetical protein n=1 Tax=Halosimplex halophilum TaxID=2559572 RepID=UPI00107FC437|nr:hypothetical protein [Halosimplex halophilum]